MYEVSELQQWLEWCCTARDQPASVSGVLTSATNRVLGRQWAGPWIWGMKFSGGLAPVLELVEARALPEAAGTVPRVE